ncbi:CmpA/NrtA family ABC transporter substrate-binding protein [Phenylobacterium sp.]|uniref:CmpA/NrtA family ABC transporter substrate-binding protein n=1 Tax=Phenylobacterium sp. TaxID=1871053 RepID=UPI00301CAA1E
MTRLRLGFVALNDAAALIAAGAKGFFAAEGLEVDLVREVSWATIRDKVDVGALHGAHMLAPMALAATAGAELRPLVAPMALNLNGPAVTLSSRLAGVIDPAASAQGLAALIARRRDEGASGITLAVVFPHSTHNYLLRDWLSRAGIDPDRDVRINVAPPARMTELLVSGVVEGICVTEPWGAAAVTAGAGRTAVRASQLWPRTPDKVLALAEAWAAENPEVVQALVRAILRGAAWAERNRPELAALLSEPAYVAAPAAVIAPSLEDMIFHAGEANAPDPAHAAWLLAQMVRWNHLPVGVDAAAIAARVYRPDLYRAARDSLAAG